ncbi:MAG: KamA family radical SAM protein [Suipraeoptans sp.]
MTWTEKLKDNITTAEEIRTILNLNDEDTNKLDNILDQYPMTIPKYYLSLINLNDENDPIRKMCIPSIHETSLDGDFDTSGEASNTVVPGLQHKYTHTTLFLSTHVCAMYCRYCFRKRLVGTNDDEIGNKNFEKIVDYISTHTEISNVLISGGDSFMNSNETIAKYLEAFCKIDHLDCLRFGTRVPVTFPYRITEDPELLEILKKYNKKKQIYVVTHFNHTNEITEEARLSIKLLAKTGIRVLNQSVLLRGVNDNPNVLGLLLKKLTSIGIIPYYIFQCRPVTGVKGQFQIPIIEGYQIVESAKQLQNGIAKSVHYIMSHETGKLEILGPGEDGNMMFKFHQSKSPENTSKIFTKELDNDQCWL